MPNENFNNLMACIVCKSEQIVPFKTLYDYRLCNLEEGFSYKRCASCGLIFQDPQLSSERMSSHYNQNNIYSDKSKKGGIRQALFKFGLKKRSNIVLKNRSTGTLLDIGCGSGEFINYISRRTPLTVEATEINEENVRMIKERFDIKVELGNIENLNFPNNYFNVITLWDVIEHLNDPNQTLQVIRKIINNNGILIIRIPNGDCLDFKLFERYWAGLDAPRHFFTFRKKTITKLLENNFFRVESTQTDIGGYLNFVTSLQFWLCDRKINKKISSLILKVLKHPIPQIIFFPFFWIKNKTHQGTAITIIAVPI